MLLNYFYAFMTALCATLLMVPSLRRWAIDHDEVDSPDERKVHQDPTPRLGGIAIFLSFLFAALIFAPTSPLFRGLLAGSLVVFATGTADDLQTISSRNKFLGLIIAALVTITVGNLWIHDLGDLFGFGRIVLPIWLGVPFTVFAVVGMSNALNLIDGLDGLAGGVAVLALAAFAMLAHFDGNPLVTVLAVALAGAILGFLKYNFYPARIFMGDAGSLTIGFVVGFLAVMLTQLPGAKTSPMLPVLILGVPIFDALWVMSLRLAQRQNPFVADRSHLHHRFLALGFRHRMTVLIIYTMSLFMASSALLLSDLPEYLLLLYLLGSALLCYLLLLHLRAHPDRYRFTRHDTDHGLRATVLFQQGVTAVDRTMPLLGILLLLYALLATACLWHNGTGLWSVVVVLLVFGIWGAVRGEFQRLLVYAVACLAAFAVWPHGEAVIAGLSAKRLGDMLLLGMLLLSELKLIFHRKDEFFFDTSDYLAMVLMVFLFLAAMQSELVGIKLGGPLLRAMVLMLAVLALSMQGHVAHRLLFHTSLALLGLFTTVGAARFLF